MSAVVHFSTDEIAPRLRLAVWREALFQTEFNVDIEPISNVPFREEQRSGRYPACAFYPAQARRPHIGATQNASSGMK
jgi:hypothetical protein